MNLLDIAEVGAAGAVGAATRYLTDRAVSSRRADPLPVATIAINLGGSLLLGFLTGLVLYHAAPSRLTLIAGTGFCGGFTTFSTFAYETARLWDEGASRAAVVNVALTLAGALLAATVGLAVASI